MSTATKIFCALTVALLLSASSANAQWVGGVRTWPSTQSGVSGVSAPNSGTETYYVPFISDYGTYWGQDNYDTIASSFVASGQVVAASCWQSWTGSAVECPNPATTAGTGAQYQYLGGFGGITSEDAWDYFYVEFSPSSSTSYQVIGVVWEQ
jgi:hypothetical protein